MTREGEGEEEEGILSWLSDSLWTILVLIVDEMNLADAWRTSTVGSFEIMIEVNYY